MKTAQKRLRDLKGKISAQSKKNFVLERDVRYLDSRIALLIQNRMALDEVGCFCSYLSLETHRFPPISNVKSNERLRRSIRQKVTTPTTAKSSSTPISSSFSSPNRATSRLYVGLYHSPKSTPSFKLLCSPCTETNTKAEKSTFSSRCFKACYPLNLKLPLNSDPFFAPIPLFLA